MRFLSLNSWSTFLLAGSISIASHAGSLADSYLQQIGDTFVQSVPTDWGIEQGSWQYADIVDCFLTKPTCFGNNPSSPYGSPAFGSDPDQMVPTFQLRNEQAIVIFQRTPPSSRYFGFTQYLYSRPEDATPVFASLSETMNQTDLQLIDGSGQKFDNYSVLVWSGNQTTIDQTMMILNSMGIASQNVNVMKLPTTISKDQKSYQIKWGVGAQSDVFNMLMRIALPDVAQNLKNYIQEKPFYVLRLSPGNSIAPTFLTGENYKSDLTDRKEDPQLQVALDALVKDIKKNYFRAYSYADQSVKYTSKTGWDCILGASQCLGDNYDALYSRDVNSVVQFSKIEDFVMVVGINHQKTGKATYINHSVYDTKKLAGITAVADPQLVTQSALYHAGIVNPKDPRFLQYKNLYAYMISYNCGSTPHCLQIPPPTPENPVGLEPLSPFVVSGRAYLEPINGTRPSELDIIRHQVFIGKKR